MSCHNFSHQLSSHCRTCLFQVLVIPHSTSENIGILLFSFRSCLAHSDFSIWHPLVQLSLWHLNRTVSRYSLFFRLNESFRIVHFPGCLKVNIEKFSVPVQYKGWYLPYLLSFCLLLKRAQCLDGCILLFAKNSLSLNWERFFWVLLSVFF